MAHQRELIREAVIRILSNATAAGTRVTSTRVDAHKKNELPALSVYTLSEEVEPASDTSSPRELTRKLNLEIAGWVAHSAALPVEIAMDDLAREIENAMDADVYLSDLAGDSMLTATEMTIVEEKIDPLVGIVTLTYSVTYRTFVGATPATDDFNTAGTTTQIVGATTGNAASDVIDVQETP